MINGVRHFWFGSNNKAQWPTTMDLTNQTYYQSGHATTNLTMQQPAKQGYYELYRQSHNGFVQH